MQLLPDFRCAIFGQPGRPAVCASLRPSESMCGANREEALAMLMQDPEFVKLIMGPQPMPRHRQKWQTPPKPTSADMLTKARTDQGLLTSLNRRFNDNIRRISMADFGIFEEFRLQVLIKVETIV